jgi:phosphoribosyl 1,2-cyclic phosphodiesterase
MTCENWATSVDKPFFYSLSSGSSGNCYYLGTREKGILIDAGIPAGLIRKFLKDQGISPGGLQGILLSHNHTDHTRGLEVLTRKNHIPVYTTAMVWRSILSRKNAISGVSFRDIGLRQAFRLNGFEIQVFPLSHDAPETIGFQICHGDFTTSIATDLGHVCRHSAPYLKAANLLIIESNYDEGMLMKGSYPYFLKARILSDQGHLGNHQTAAFLADIHGSKLRHVCLAHLSQHNNSPEMALQTQHEVFAERGIPLSAQPQFSVLRRNQPSELIKLS